MNKEVLLKLITPGTDEDVIASYSSLPQRAEDTVFGLEEEEIVILDTETTGFNPRYAQIIEVAASIMKGPQVIASFSSFVVADKPIPEEITRLTGITDEMVADAPNIDMVMKELFKFVGDRNIVAHNSDFDRRFLEYAAGGQSFPGEWFDSLKIARIALPRLTTHRLGDLAIAFCDETADHRATSDVAALAQLWRVLLVGLSDLPPGLLRFVVMVHPSTHWPERAILSHIAAASPDQNFDLKASRQSRVAADKGMNRQDAEEVILSFPEEERISGEFTQKGIAGAMYPGYEARSEQVAMAHEVLKAFSTETHRAIEAGTGVGKSVAYLLPAALFAKDNGVAVGVATKTNALMDQLIYHELPRLNAALDTPLRYVALKGYDHYPCLRKAERYAREDNKTTADGLSMLAMLYAWAAQSSWGDLDTINLYWRDLPRDAIVSTPGECLHGRCRFYPNLCYLHGVRRRAESSDIVVTNHALLFRDVVAQGGILPTLRHWVVDEAHSVESEARKQLSVGITHNETAAVLEAIHSKRGGLTGGIRRKSKGLPGADMLIGPLTKLEDQTLRTLVISESFFSFVKDLAVLADNREYDRADLWVNEEVRNSGPWGVVDSAGRSLEKRLAEVLATCKTLLSLMENFGSDLSEHRANLSSLAIRLADAQTGLVAVLDGSDTGKVYSASLDRRPDIRAEELVAANLDIGEVLLEEFYPRTKSVIYTSATIATGESFSYFAQSVGLDRLPEGAWSSLRLTSSYDFEKNMQVYSLTDMPEPSHPSYLAALEEFLLETHVAMGGSVLTLFTNRRDMERLYTRLREPLEERGSGLICQTRGTSAKRLRDEFLADTDLSLFALRSFWEGFDAPGNTLRCVIIPKLPFGRPTDPLSCERNLREGGAAWKKYALPDAIIDVKQAAGRLIRSSTDKGCLVIADSRIVSKWYGKQFLKALPVEEVKLGTTIDVPKDIRSRKF